MGWLKKAVRNYLNISDDIKSEVRNQLGLSAVELNYVQADKLLKYYQELNYIFFNGDPTILERFHKLRRKPSGSLDNPFWKVVDDDITKIHYPLPSSISRSMAHILFSDELEFKVDTGNKTVSKVLTTRLEKILKDNNKEELLQKGAILESYSGSLGAPLVNDLDFSDSPIIQFYPAEQILIETKYGRIFEVIFLDEYEVLGKSYVLRTECGYGYISYSLRDENDNEVNLSKVPELSHLKDIAIVNSNGEPIKVLMAEFKPNKSVSSQFSDMQYGASDYEGLHGIFNTLDEIVSQWSDRYRNSGIITFISEDNLKRNSKTGDIIPLNKYGLRTQPLYDAVLENKKENRLDRDVPNMDVTSFEKGFESNLKMALQRAGLSPITMGLLDSISVLSSQESVNEREKVTLKTRQEKIKLWKEFLARLSRLLLIYDDMKDMKPIEQDGALIYKLDNEYDYNFMIEFPQYSFPSRSEQLRNADLAIKGGLGDHETVLAAIYKDELTAEELAKMIDNILTRANLKTAVEQVQVANQESDEDEDDKDEVEKDENSKDDKDKDEKDKK